MITAQQANAKLDALLAEKERLVAERAELNRQLGRIESRIADLDGGWSRFGEIRKARDELKDAQLAEADALLSTVHFIDCCPSNRYVVDKVTAKQIAIRIAGGTRRELYHHDGTNVAHRYAASRIDIAKTFPAGLPIKAPK